MVALSPRAAPAMPEPSPGCPGQLLWETAGFGVWNGLGCGAGEGLECSQCSIKPRGCRSCQDLKNPGQGCLGKGQGGDEEQGMQLRAGNAVRVGITGNEQGMQLRMGNAAQSGSAVHVGLTGKEVLHEEGSELLLPCCSHLHRRLWDLLGWAVLQGLWEGWGLSVLLHP